MGAPVSPSTAAKIEAALDADDWEEARALIERALEDEPENHWLLTRLGLTYYEQFDYARALAYTEQALSLAPTCWLALWDYATTLEMLDRPRDAIKIFAKILRRDVESLANDQCGEGRARARGLRSDTLYRAALTYQTLGKPKKAAAFVAQSLAERGPGCESIYPIAEVRTFAASLSSTERTGKT